MRHALNAYRRRDWIVWIAIVTGGIVFGSDLRAQTGSALRIAVQRKRVDKKEKSQLAENVTVETWVYSITLENASFKEMTGLKAQYRVYRLDDERGATRQEVGLKWDEGEGAVGTLKPREKKTIETKPTKIETVALKGGWSYTDGSKDKIQDRVKGVRVKVFQGEELIVDYANPTTLIKSDKW
jgi:hypothetical protein